MKTNLDEEHWTWQVSAVQRERLDSPKVTREKGNLMKKIYRLHWIAPASGMYLARNFAEEKVIVFIGFVFVLISLLVTQEVFRTLGIIQQLRIWEKETGKPLLLREVWQEMMTEADER